MCGIAGCVSQSNVVPGLLAQLRRLEYRGYDSAGLAVAEASERGGHVLKVRRAPGRFTDLTTLVDQQPLSGKVGIAHTRWATHGAPSERNAHPHLDCTGRIAVVHNGTVENFYELQRLVIAGGHVLVSDTDSELIAHLIESAHDPAKGVESFVAAVRHSMDGVSGAHAFLAMSADHPDLIVAARKGHAGGLIVGTADGRTVVASDLVAMGDDLLEFFALGDRHIAVLRTGQVTFFDVGNSSPTLEVPPAELLINLDPDLEVARTSHGSDFLTEVHEQPLALRHALSSWLNSGADFESTVSWLVDARRERGLLTGRDMRRFTKIQLLACGTPLHACMAAREVFEDLIGLTTVCDYSHEFARRRNVIVDESTLVVVVSQSGETADTLLALRRALDAGASTLVITNVPSSTAARQADGVIYMRCGPEYSVAQTKAFTSELTCLFMLAIALADVMRKLTLTMKTDLIDELLALPRRIGQVLSVPETVYTALAEKYVARRSFLFLARGRHYPIALEGALKLKELSYLHAEGYAAGEMKHGPIALIEDGYPVVAIVPEDETRVLMLAQLAQVKARGAEILAVAVEGDRDVERVVDDVIWLPEGLRLTGPIVAVVPLQLFAYYVAVRRGCEVDRPRNLAKSVTVI